MSELKAIRSGEIYNIIEYEDCYRTDDLYYPKSEVDAVIAELKRENRRVKRALWLARAERAVAEQTVDEWSRYKEKHPFGSWRAEPFEYWVQEWICVEKICRKKAEEYK